ncbi:hypothetical protein WNZ14_21790 [Hoeflea sp. AS60]|uniref:hypothetical protein n=1 Tax=Hoeflea sp. AS60 TaxID=3135780 RepID=UPI0031706575
MIVGATQTIAPEPTKQSTVPADRQPDDAPSQALDRLGNLAESAAQSRKAFAEERLKQLKEQMNKLMLFDMAPGALAGQSAQLAKELKSAASEFAGSFRALAEFRQPAETGFSLAQQAYLDIDDAPVVSTPVLDRSDLETIDSFTSAAEQIASIADSAKDKLTATDGANAFTTSARTNASGIMDLMASLKSGTVSKAFYW